MCTVLLPPGVNPIAVNKYINSILKYSIYLQQDNPMLFPLTRDIP